MRKKKSKNNYGNVIGLVVIAVFAVAVSVSAVGGLVQNYYIETATINNPTDGVADVEEQVFGASGDNNLSSFTTLDMITNGMTWDGPAYFTSSVDFSGADSIDLTATTTPSPATYFPISVALDLTGTSSIKGATQNVVAYYTNTGADKIFEWGGIDFEVKNSIFAASYQCGTSTWVGGVAGGSLTTSSSPSVIASTTIALAETTITRGTVLDSHGNVGSGIADNKIVFPLLNNEVFFCTRTIWGAANSATSSDSFDTTKGYTAAGRMLGQIWARGN